MLKLKQSKYFDFLLNCSILKIFYGYVLPRYILIVKDCGSKMIWTFPTRTTDGEEVRRHLTTLFRKAGKPHIISSDNGSGFVSTETKNFMKENKVKKRCGRAGHPRKLSFF